MTGQTLLDTMELLNQELQLQPAEADVTRGLLALNIAQDYFESLVAVRKNVLGSSNPVGTVSTTASTESTTFPTGLLRIDRLQVITNNRPSSELRRLHRVGGQAFTGIWPWNLVSTPGTGVPSAYWTNGTNIYWAPVPDAIYTIRYYGFVAAADITASGTFLYPDIVRFPVASFAARLLKGGLDDPATDVAALANEAFKAALDTLSNFNRDGSPTYEYTTLHDA